MIQLWAWVPLTGTSNIWPAENIGGADTSGDHGGSGTVDSGIRTLGTAQAKFHDTVSLGCMDHAGCLGGDQALVVDDI